MNLPDHYPKRPSTVMGESNDYSAVNTDGNPDANADFLQSYEYVLVFPMAKDFTSETKEARYCMNEMLAAGLEIFPYKSIQDDELLVLVRAPVSVYGHKPPLLCTPSSSSCKRSMTSLFLLLR